MVANILKYRSSNLIILYCYTYSRLSDIIKITPWNSMELIRDIRFGSLVDE